MFKEEIYFPPKSNIDTQNDVFFKTYLFSNISYFWCIQVSFRGWVALRPEPSFWPDVRWIQRHASRRLPRQVVFWEFVDAWSWCGMVFRGGREIWMQPASEIHERSLNKAQKVYHVISWFVEKYVFGKDGSDLSCSYSMTFMDTFLFHWFWDIRDGCIPLQEWDW